MGREVSLLFRRVRICRESRHDTIRFCMPTTWLLSRFSSHRWGSLKTGSSPTMPLVDRSSVWIIGRSQELMQSIEVSELLLRYSFWILGRVRMGNGPTIWLFERSSISRQYRVDPASL
jgi:hypothetical protein